MWRKLNYIHYPGALKKGESQNRTLEAKIGQWIQEIMRAVLK